MKTIIIFLFAFILFADSPKHNFTFTIEINGISLKQAADLEKEIMELVEGYENKSVKVEMNTIKTETNDWEKYLPNPELKEYLKFDTLKLITPQSGDWIYIDNNRFLRPIEK